MNFANYPAALLLIAAMPQLAFSASPKSETISPQVVESKLAEISGNPVRLKEAIKQGKASAQFCRHCHGVGGYSVMPDTPNLASQNAAYMAEQMNKLADGRRKSEFMEGLIKALTLDERVNIALYFANQPAPTPINTDPAKISAGKTLYGKVCINCHGTSGAGTNKVPRIAGQQAKYARDSLKRYRSGSGERIDLQMASYTRNLKDADIENLVAYISSMP